MASLFDDQDLEGEILEKLLLLHESLAEVELRVKATDETCDVEDERGEENEEEEMDVDTTHEAQPPNAGSGSEEKGAEQNDMPMNLDTSNTTAAAAASGTSSSDVQLNLFSSFA